MSNLVLARADSLEAQIEELRTPSWDFFVSAPTEVASTVERISTPERKTEESAALIEQTVETLLRPLQLKVVDRNVVTEEDFPLTDRNRAGAEYQALKGLAAIIPHVTSARLYWKALDDVDPLYA